MLQQSGHVWTVLRVLYLVFSAANGHGGSQSSLCLASSVRWFVTFLPIEGISQRQESEDDEQFVSGWHDLFLPLRHGQRYQVKFPSLGTASFEADLHAHRLIPLCL